MKDNKIEMNCNEKVKCINQAKDKRNEYKSDGRNDVCIE